MQKENLELLYSSLAVQSLKDFTVYFVDNNSTTEDRDASVLLAEKYLIEVKYIIPGNNTGFAGGNNLGAQQAIADGCKYVFFLNNDTELHTDCLKELTDLMNSNPEIGISAPIIYYGSGNDPKITVQELGASADFRHYKIKKNFEGAKLHMVQAQLPEIQYCDLVSGGAAFARAEALNRSGLWEESYFAYGDEIDLAKRIAEAGYKSAAIPKAILWHNHKWDKTNKAGYYFEYYLIQRNKYLYFKKFGYKLSLLTSLFMDNLMFPWRLLWFMKVCDLKLGICYLRGTLAGLAGHKGAPPILR